MDGLFILGMINGNSDRVEALLEMEWERGCKG